MHLFSTSGLFFYIVSDVPKVVFSTTICLLIVTAAQHHTHTLLYKCDECSNEKITGIFQDLLVINHVPHILLSSIDASNKKANVICNASLEKCIKQHTGS